MPKGAFKRLIADRGLGLIRTERGEDLFFHRNQLEGVDFNSLREGQQVEFEVRPDPSGRPHAMRVRLAQPTCE